MGSIYKRIWTDKTTGEKIKRDTFWISYYRDGKQLRESAETSSLVEAKQFLANKEGDIAKGIPVTPKMGRMKFSELAADVVKELRRMWKKSEPEVSRSQPEPAPQAQSSQAQQSSAPQTKEQATIGPKISFKGNLTGEEDLLIEGSLDGMIEVRKHSVMIGKKGQVKADVYGKIIIIEGTVEGNLYAEERLIVRQSGTVRGKIVSPQVALEIGCNFNGSIDMNPKEKPTTTTIPDKPTIGMKAT